MPAAMRQQHTHSPLRYPQAAPCAAGKGVILPLFLLIHTSLRLPVCHWCGNSWRFLFFVSCSSPPLAAPPASQWRTPRRRPRTRTRSSRRPRRRWDRRRRGGRWARRRCWRCTACSSRPQLGRAPRTGPLSWTAARAPSGEVIGLALPRPPHRWFCTSLCTATSREVEQMAYTFSFPSFQNIA